MEASMLSVSPAVVIRKLDQPSENASKVDLTLARNITSRLTFLKRKYKIYRVNAFIQSVVLWLGEKFQVLITELRN